MSEDRIDEVLEALEQDSDAVSKAFGGARKASFAPEPKFTDVKRPSVPRTYTKGSNIPEYPNMYIVDEDGQPVCWVGQFYDENVAWRWAERHDFNVLVEFDVLRRGLPTYWVWKEAQ